MRGFFVRFAARAGSWRKRERNRKGANACVRIHGIRSRLARVLVRREGFRSHVGRAASWRESVRAREEKGVTLHYLQVAFPGKKE